MATFHSGSEGQTQKLQALRRRQKRLAFRAVIVPPVCWGICAASAPWWFPPLKETLGVRFDAQTQGWILLVMMLLMISLPVLISLHLKRRARGAKYAATLVSSGIRGEEDARALLSRLPGRVHLYYFDITLKSSIVDEVAISLAVLSDIHFKIVHQLSSSQPLVWWTI